MISGFKFPIGIYALRAKEKPNSGFSAEIPVKRLIKTLAIARRAFISLTK